MIVYCCISLNYKCNVTKYVVSLTRTYKRTHMPMYIGNHLQCAFRIRSADTLRNWPTFSKYAQWSIQNTNCTDLRVHLLYIMHIRSSFVRIQIIYNTQLHTHTHTHNNIHGRFHNAGLRHHTTIHTGCGFL